MKFNISNAFMKKLNQQLKYKLLNFQKFFLEHKLVYNLYLGSYNNLTYYGVSYKIIY